MIFGIGFDIVAVPRMQEDLTRYGDRFAGKILHEDEWTEYEHSIRKAHYLAKHFAAKEALVKALGTGFGIGITLKDIVISHTSSGQPVIVYHGRLKEVIEEKGILSCHLTLSDEHQYACACVILER